MDERNSINKDIGLTNDTDANIRINPVIPSERPSPAPEEEKYDKDNDESLNLTQQDAQNQNERLNLSQSQTQTPKNNKRIMRTEVTAVEILVAGPGKELTNVIKDVMNARIDRLILACPDKKAAEYLEKKIKAMKGGILRDSHIEISVVPLSMFL